MAFPTIIYNASTGSDTLASGAGPATAVTGTAAAHTGGVASTTITLTNSPDLSGVLTDGSHALWLGQTGARRLTKITGVDNTAKTVTVEDSFNIASGSAVNYAIGGKRQTLNGDTTNRDWADWKAGWTAEFEAGTYDTPVTLDHVAGDVTSGHVTMRAATGAAPIIRSTANVWTVDVKTRHQFIGLTFTTSSATKTATASMRSTDGNAFEVVMKGCTIDGLQFGVRSHWQIAGTFIANVFKNLVSHVIQRDTFHVGGIWLNNVMKDNGGVGFSCNGSTRPDVTFKNNIVHNNAGGGIQVGSPNFGLIEGNVIDGNGGDGIDINSNAVVINNVITNNSGYGINVGTTWESLYHILVDHNAFLNNTSGLRNNVSAGANDVTLTADPYTSRATDDFTLNNTAGGGAACIDAGYPQQFAG